MLTRAVTGAVAGVVGALLTASASLGLYLGFCGFETPWPWEERCLAGPYAEYGLLLLPVALLLGLVGTALLHVWLLKLCSQPRPWSVVAPGMALVLVLLGIEGRWGMFGAFAVPATAFAVAGVVTGFGSWRKILRGRAG